MWSYYGSKSIIVDLYPSPKYDKIIEPFAGSARYSLKYFDRDILLVDKYEVIIDIWKYLQKCSPSDILGLPRFKKGDKISEFNLSEEEKLFCGMMAGVASTSPRNTVSMFSADQNGSKNKMQRIADSLYKIKHWEFECKDYNDINNEQATWFIDPPYQFGGYAYKYNKIDFKLLSIYCQERKGQVIVCENTKADWMPFRSLSKMRGANMKFTTEAIWTNSSFIQQQELF